MKHFPDQSKHSTKDRLSSYIDLRVDCFRAIYELTKRPNPIYELSFGDIESKLRVTRKTAIQICHNLRKLFELELIICRGGIQLGHRFYYQEQMWKDENHKDAISDAFVAELEKHRVHGLASSPGTTVTTCMKKLLPRRNLYRQIVTNNLSIRELLNGESHNTCIIAGGIVNRDINATLGRGACDAFERSRCDSGLLGVSGLDEDGSLYVQYYEEVEVLDRLLRSVRHRIYVVAAIEKLTMDDIHKICSLDDLLKGNPELEICVITTPPESLSTQEKKDRAERVVEKLQDIDRNRVNLIIAPLKEHDK